MRNAKHTTLSYPESTGHSLNGKFNNHVNSSTALSTHRPAADREKMGAVYTPNALADWVANLAKRHCNVAMPVIYDPACGDGSLLSACRRVFGSECITVGSDVSPGAVQRALASPELSDAQIRVCDSLTDPFGDAARADICIMNPPWGAQLDDAEALRAEGFSLIGGKHDSWETFIEWSFLKLKPGSLVAAILPGAFHQSSTKKARELISERGTLLATADLGEGLFRKVFRSTVVVLYRNSPDRESRKPTRYKMNQGLRKEVLRGTVELDEAVVIEETHDLPPVFSRVAEYSQSWSDFCFTSRGVELGARGIVEQCQECSLFRPAAREPKRCARCGSERFESTQAITEYRQPGSVPIIVGKDVSWFDVSPGAWIKTGLDGIRYKDTSQYAGPKLLIRKTGLGLNVGVDVSSALTNQVVFSYKNLPGVPEWWLYFFLGILGSDALLAFHLTRTGDTAWRSHPYVTPSVLHNYPVLIPGVHVSDSEATKIAGIAMELNSKENPIRETRLRSDLNRSVNLAFELGQAGSDWIAATFRQTQGIRSFQRARTAL